MYRLVQILCILALLGACSTTPKEESEYRRGIELSNWETCAQVYAKNDVPTFHRGHLHRKHSKLDKWDIKDDLLFNQCRSVLGDAWLNY